MPDRSPNRPIRVLFLTDLLEVGGAEMQLVDLARAFDPTEVEVEVALLREGGALVGRLARAPHLLRRGGAWDPRPLVALRRLVADRGISIVVTTHVWSLLYARALSIILGPAAPRVFATVHSYRRPAASPLLQPFWRHALRHAERVIAVSNAQADWLVSEAGLSRARVTVLPNAVDLERCAAVDPAEDPGLLLSVARLVAEKDHATLLESFRLLLRAGRRGLALVLLGDGPLRASIEATVRRMEPELSAADARIEILGAVDDPRPWLAKATLVLLASRHESQGIALLEAMAAGRAVVATRVGGIPEVVLDGTTGLLVPAGDPARFADAVGALLDDAPRRARFGESGRRRVEAHFSLASRALSLQALFAERPCGSGDTRS